MYLNYDPKLFVLFWNQTYLQAHTHTHIYMQNTCFLPLASVTVFGPVYVEHTGTYINMKLSFQGKVKSTSSWVKVVLLWICLFLLPGCSSLDSKVLISCWFNVKLIINRRSLSCVAYYVQPSCVSYYVQPIMCSLSCVACYVQPIMCSLSCVACYVQPIMCGLSCVAYCVQPIMCALSCVACYVQPIMCGLSCVACYVQPIMCGLSCVAYCVQPIMCALSCVAYCVQPIMCALSCVAIQTPSACVTSPVCEEVQEWSIVYVNRWTP